MNEQDIAELTNLAATAIPALVALYKKLTANAAPGSVKTVAELVADSDAVLDQVITGSQT